MELTFSANISEIKDIPTEAKMKQRGKHTEKKWIQKNKDMWDSNKLSKIFVIGVMK